MASIPQSRPHSTHHPGSSFRPTSPFAWIRLLIALIAISSLPALSLAAVPAAPHSSNHPTFLAGRDIIGDAANNTPTTDLTPQSEADNDKDYPPIALTNEPATPSKSRTQHNSNLSENSHDATTQTKPEETSPTPTTPAQILPFPIPYWLYDTPTNALGGGLLVGIMGTCALWAVIFGVKAVVWCVGRMWCVGRGMGRRRGGRGGARTRGGLGLGAVRSAGVV